MVERFNGIEEVTGSSPVSSILLNKISSGEKKRISTEEALFLFQNATLFELASAADKIRTRIHEKNSNKISFVVDRNINYTNVCVSQCRFCAFWRPLKHPESYVLSYPEIKQKIDELVSLGGTQVLMQGGHNPELKINYYEELFKLIKKDFPTVTLHSLSPSEIDYVAKISNLSLIETLKRLRDAGLDSIPGGGAEILVDSVRQKISPNKINSEKWLSVMEEAHKLGMESSATMMFGHLETPQERIEHLNKLRDLQDRTDGFRAFICWTFQDQNNSLGDEIKDSRKTCDSLDYLKTLALSRIFLDNFKNIQVSWVTQGLSVGQIGLHFGANDFGGTMLEENVVSAAGCSVQKSSRKEEIIYNIQKAGFQAFQRKTNYQPV